MITVAASVITRPSFRDREIFMITETLRAAKPGRQLPQMPGELRSRENCLRVGIDSLTEG
jgi:hypothetical protein